MECNKEEAAKAKEIAEKKFKMKDIYGAKNFALKAQRIYPKIQGVSQMIATFDVYIAAECKDWYGILNASLHDDHETLKRKYKKLALMLHPDKNKSIGAEGAFNHVFEAWKFLSDKENREEYDRMKHAQRSMESNKEKAARAKEIAEKKFKMKDIYGAKNFALKAQRIYPKIQGVSQLIATFDVYIAAEDEDWYGILNASLHDDHETLKRKYKKLALMLHPEKNKSIGAEGAFNHVFEAWKFLSDKENREEYDRMKHAQRSMECNKEEAARAKEIAEEKFKMKDISGAKEYALKAQSLYPEIEGISLMLAVLNVYIAAENKVNGEVDWYGILNASKGDSYDTLLYKTSGLYGWFSRNKVIGAEGAVKHIVEAWSFLSKKENRAAYNRKISVSSSLCNFVKTIFTRNARKHAQRRMECNFAKTIYARNARKHAQRRMECNLAKDYFH